MLHRNVKRDKHGVLTLVSCHRGSAGKTPGLRRVWFYSFPSKTMIQHLKDPNQPFAARSFCAFHSLGLQIRRMQMHRTPPSCWCLLTKMIAESTLNPSSRAVKIEALQAAHAGSSPPVDVCFSSSVCRSSRLAKFDFRILFVTELDS